MDHEASSSTAHHLINNEFARRGAKVGFAALAAIGAYQIAPSLIHDIGHDIGQAIEHGFDDALHGLGINTDIPVGPQPVRAAASVDTKSEKVVPESFEYGAHVTEYVGVKVVHNHFGATSVFNKLLPGDASLCDDTGKIPSLLHTTAVNGKVVDVSFTFPGGEICSPRLNLTDPAMDAALRPGMSEKTINQTIAAYEDAVIDGKNPTPDTGVDWQGHWWTLGTAFLSDADKQVTNVGEGAAQLAISLDAFPDSKVANEEKQLQEDAKAQVEQQYPHAEVDMKIVSPTIEQELEQRWQQLKGLPYLYPTEHFSKAPNGTLQFTATTGKEGQGIDATISLSDDHLNGKQISTLNNFINKHIKKLFKTKQIIY